MKRTLVTALAVLLLTACQGSHRTHFSEGNLIEPEMIAGMRIGMSKEQVAKQMGTPVYENLFRKNRWVYIHHIRNGNAHHTEEMLLDFDNNRLINISRSPQTLPSK